MKAAGRFKASHNRAVVAVALLSTALWPLYAEAAATGLGPGFWAGAMDGFLALLKLLVSPVMDLSIVDPAAVDWAYDAGYYLGVLTFAGMAGMAAAAPDSEQADVVAAGTTVRKLSSEVRPG